LARVSIHSNTRAIPT